ncbi:hypothetical protein [endosymbiont GvMRE of Glomus versiforme]|uniref:hypothetical protein n=1 Tax=endosymbiont GvMRE of Glomus versiforme TaxID=2039283 RepID=UPI000ECBB40C|nr:hypothetical protein [endosymbiont GvMRE of Glomus versiforme]RHZ36123.1 hypothetical protein GvMRE_Ic2g136 [endosymbiont GvMRE of Glomus versiforme]
MTKTNHKRTKPWGLKVHENFFWKVKQTALKERCEVVELVERVLSDYMEHKNQHTHTHTHTHTLNLKGEKH